MRRTSSGSSCSARPVNPTRSAKKTVTTLRSSRASSFSAPSGAAQLLQKRAPSGFSWPQFEQTGSMQKGYEAEGASSRRYGLTVPKPRQRGSELRWPLKQLGGAYESEKKHFSR